MSSHVRSRTRVLSPRRCQKMSPLGLKRSKTTFFFYKVIGVAAPALLSCRPGAIWWTPILMTPLTCHFKTFQAYIGTNISKINLSFASFCFKLLHYWKCRLQHMPATSKDSRTGSVSHYRSFIVKRFEVLHKKSTHCLSCHG